MTRLIKNTILLVLFSSPVFAQQELGLHFMRHAWHANETNPAIVREEGGVFRLPGLYNGLAFDGPSYGQLVSRVNGEPVINVDDVIDHLEPENVIKDDFVLQTIGFAFPVRKKLVLSFGHSIKYNGFFKFPKTLPQVVYQGNAQFIGETVDIGNELQITGYHSVDMGVAYKFGQLTLGAKAKFMSGFSDASTDPSRRSVSLYTDPDIYELTLAGDYVLNSTNTVDYRSYDDFDYDFNFGTFTTDRFFDGNTGWAFDLGARYQTEKWDVAVSVIDMGKINWSSGVTNYVVDGVYEYEGLDFSEALTGGDSPDIEQALDTLEQIFEVTETNNSYSTKIPRKIYFSVLYNLNEKFRFGAVYFNEDFRNVSTTSVGIGGNMDLTRWLNAGFLYAVSGDSFDNLGLNLTLQSRTFQVFAASDNVIDIFNPTQGNNFSIRLGGNLYF